MGENSKISWTDHTFNCWWGCCKVSAGCARCYAEVFSKYTGRDVWGADKPRFHPSDRYWRQPFKWDKAARIAGKRARVFCASMADVFEDRRDLDDDRARLWGVINQTPRLDWLLLTKRPENMIRLTPASWLHGWPFNAWAMTTVENQEVAEQRIEVLLEVPARIHGLSCEPLLGPLDLSPWVSRISWTIIGGESGGGQARTMEPEWALDLIRQCKAAGVPVFFKQAGNVLAKRWGLSGKSDLMVEWPPEFRIQEYPA